MYTMVTQSEAYTLANLQGEIKVIGKYLKVS